MRSPIRINRSAIAIESINVSDLTEGAFFGKYFAPEIPVVIRQVDIGTKGCWDGESLIEALDRSAASVEKVPRTWFDNDRYFLDEHCSEPAIVTQMLAPGLSCVRQTCRRFWVHKKGHITRWHYDGNSLFVFNLQVLGRKLWTIISPETPLCCYPFDRVAVPFAFERPSDQTEYCQFITDEGDMLFLPPYWLHRVEALVDNKININWVGTKRSYGVASKTSLREKRMIKLRSLNRRFGVDRIWADDSGSDEITEYAGEGLNFVNYFTEDVSISTALKWCMAEWALAIRMKLASYSANGNCLDGGESGNLLCI